MKKGLKKVVGVFLGICMVFSLFSEVPVSVGTVMAAGNKGSDGTVVKNAPINVQKVEGLSEDFIHGVDASMYLSEVQSGVRYYDEEGNEKNLFEILKEKGVNWVRLRLWNCPYAVDKAGNYKYIDAEGNEYSADEVEVWKSDVSSGEAQKEWEEYCLKNDHGKQVYREGYGAGNCGIDTVKAIGKIASSYGMKILVDFHYSDFWADPKKQSVPKEWEGMTLEEKTAALSDFTVESLVTLRNAGVDVGMVQIGNEINNGMAGESNQDNVLKLLKAGSEAVQKVDKNILVAVHYTDPQQEGYQMKKAEALKNANVEYDVFATSFYPFWHGTPEKLTENLREIADTYGKKVMVAEVSYAWTFDDGDGYPNVVHKDAGDQEFNYPVDIEGQATAIRDTIAAVAAVGSNGIGTFYWEPAWVPVNVYNDAKNAEEVLAGNQKAWRMYGSGWGSIYAKEIDPEIKDDHNGSTWDNQAFFNFKGEALPSLNVYKWVYTGAEGPKRVSTIDSPVYTMDYHKNPALPGIVSANLNDGTIITVPAIWDAAQAEALKTADFGEYIVEGTVGEFTYNNGTEDITVPAGTWPVTCLVKVAGHNYVKNGSFENGSDGWELRNLDGSADNVQANIDKGSANAKDGLYYYSGWAEKGDAVSFVLEQTISEKLPVDKYSLLAWYQGTAVDEVKNESELYVDVTYKDGTVKHYSAEVKITNVWKDFYKAIVKDIPIDGNAASVKVGTKISCPWKEGEALGTWVVVDDISLMGQGEGSEDAENKKPAKVGKPTLKKVSKNGIKVSYKKVKGAQGYRITYSSSKKFTKKNTKSVTTTKLNKTINKLKKNKTYYVKVQAYKKDSTGKNIYGEYSAVAKIKIK